MTGFSTRRILLAFLLILPKAGAQTVFGTLLGTIQDQQGAVIPNATVSARSLETSAARTATTDASGAYHIPSVPAGLYQVTASAPGFKTAIRGDVTVTVGADIKLDFSLSVGSVTEQVEVTSEAPQ